VDRHTLTSEFLFVAEKMLLFIVPPCTVHAGRYDRLRMKAQRRERLADHRLGRCEAGRSDHDLTRSDHR